MICCLQGGRSWERKNNTKHKVNFHLLTLLLSMSVHANKLDAGISYGENKFFLGNGTVSQDCVFQLLVDNQPQLGSLSQRSISFLVK
jgi:hypothetical protein